MSYEPINWKDRIVEKPRTYHVQNNPDGTITLIPAPGTVVQEGTPVNAANLNHMEQGLVTHLAEDASLTTKGHVQLGNTSTTAAPGDHTHNYGFVASGSYTGNNQTNRTINVGFTPKAVFVNGGKFKAGYTVSNSITAIIGNIAMSVAGGGSGAAMESIASLGVAITTNGFKVGGTSGTNYPLNVSAENYTWVAVG